jgi:hypothetical protein
MNDSACYMLISYFYPEDGGDIFLRNVKLHSIQLLINVFNPVSLLRNLYVILLSF